MNEQVKWTETDLANGLIEYKLNSWMDFSDFVNRELLDFTTYVYRGHGNSNWKLEPTLDRIIKNPVSAAREEHLERFKFETRGRRGSNPSRIDNDNDWWALGQHHGLATPLLDWSESPFVALYFAAHSAVSEKSDSYIVYAIAQSSINTLNKSIAANPKIPLVNGRKQTVKIVRPYSDENKRLVSQRGLFTRGPNNVDLQSWVVNNTDISDDWMILIRIIIPNTDTIECLRHLNRMNINHSTLFPDLPGASEFCNAHLNIPKY